MIQILKPLQPPAILISKGDLKRKTHCSEYLLHKAEYDLSKRTFTFDATIYGDEAVKQALIKAQHSKCCFCERKIGADGDVEHFRPKAGYRQTSKGRLLRPGYYWLAYHWTNLFLSCSACNQRHKRNYFPLANPDQRAKSHTDSIAQESPLFIHPAHQDPEQFIGFHKEIPFAIDSNPIGKATIKALGLDRELLNEVRRDRLNILITLHKVVNQAEILANDPEGVGLVQQAKALLAEALTDAGEFAAMARAEAKENF